MKFWRFDEPTEPIVRPWGQGFHQKQAFEDGDVLLGRHSGQSFEAAIVGQLPRMLGQYVEKAGQTIELINVRDVPHVANQYQTDIILEPCDASGQRSSPQTSG